MTFLGWAIVFVLNGAIIVYGFLLARKTESSNDNGIHLSPCSHWRLLSVRACARR